MISRSEDKKPIIKTVLIVFCSVMKTIIVDFVVAMLRELHDNF